MKILVASDSYKGSLSSNEVNNIIKQAIFDVDSNIEVLTIPMADGGENSLECALGLENSKCIECEVIGPYGKKVNAHYVISNDLAFIEMAKASGILLDKTRNPMLASTIGVGQLIKDALDKGCKRFIMCLGGSATNDAGCGMAHALGVRFYKDEIELKPIPYEIKECNRIDLSHFDSRIKDCTFILACDVNNPLLGEKGASFIFGPQKGADSNMVQELDDILAHISSLLEKEINKNCRNHEGAGAAGGLGFGLMCLCNGIKQSGIETMLEMTHFEEIVQSCDLVITGEGCTDSQTAFGKTPVGVSKMAMKYNVPTILISGTIVPNTDLSEFGIIKQISTVEYGTNIDEAIQNARNNLYHATIKTIKQGIFL